MSTHGHADRHTDKQTDHGMCHAMPRGSWWKICGTYAMPYHATIPQWYRPLIYNVWASIQLSLIFQLLWNSVCISRVCRACHFWIYLVILIASKPAFQSSELGRSSWGKVKWKMALHFNHVVCHSHPSDDSGWWSPMIGPSMLHFGDVNMTIVLSWRGSFQWVFTYFYVELLVVETKLIGAPHRRGSF
jgi:hypothetical protein